MKFYMTLIMCALGISAFGSSGESGNCGTGTRDIVMMTELVNDAEAIKLYEYYHSKEGVWPEVENAARVSGILKVRIYRAANVLVMIITVPEDLDLDEMNAKYSKSSPRIAEWSELMSQFQQAPGFAEEGQVWVPMSLIHDYSEGEVK